MRDEAALIRETRGSLLSECTEPGCSALTMGGTCVAHDWPSQAIYARGRPHTPSTQVGEHLILPSGAKE